MRLLRGTADSGPADRFRAIPGDLGPPVHTLDFSRLINYIPVYPHAFIPQVNPLPGVRYLCTLSPNSGLPLLPAEVSAKTTVDQFFYSKADRKLFMPSIQAPNFSGSGAQLMRSFSFSRYPSSLDNSSATSQTLMFYILLFEVSSSFNSE
jgi:hypothetical protein